MAKKKAKKKSVYKSPLMEVYLKQSVTPKAVELAGDNWISYGSDAPYKNLYPQFLIEMYNSSATHRAIVDAASSYIAGNGVIIDDNSNTEVKSKLTAFFNNINSKESVEGLLNKTAKDLYLQGAFAWNIIYTKDKKSIASITHIPVEKLRAGVPNSNGIVDSYWISSDWSNYRRKENEPNRVPAFNANNRTDNNQIIYVTDYTPGLDVYGSPSYSSSTNWILTDGLVSEYHYNNVADGFAPTTWINFNNGSPTDEEKLSIERKIKNKFAGVGGKKMIMTFTEDGINPPDINNLALSDAHEQYQTLSTLIVQNLMIGHRVVSPSLMGVKTEGQLGGRNELLEAYELYNRSVIQPYQTIIEKTFKRLFNAVGVNTNISIKDVAPFANRFGTEVLREVMTDDEIRAELGLEPLTKDEEVVADKSELSKELSVEEIEAMLEGLGDTEESLLEDYELIATEEIDDEDEQDIEYEDRLNLGKIDLAVKTGKGYPNRKSKQDGRNKKGELFRVRYVYTGSKSPERAFCKAMMSANKIYRKEDILKMSTMAVNPGWGKGGKNTYSIWKYKGGGACKHKWFRKIYLQKGNRAINDDEVLTTTKARSKGFKPVANEQEVPVAPNDMPNKGFVNK